jgi:hypothetical protein
LNILFVFHGFAKAWAPKRKDHAQDCGTLIAKVSRSLASSDPAMVLMFRMASILPMVRASYPLRPAAGLLLDILVHDHLRKPEATFRDHASARTFQSPRVGGRMIWIGKPESYFSESCENAREMRA